MELNNGSWVA